MKRIFAILLALALLLGCAAAEPVAAETEKEIMGSVNINGAFELRCALPEGYQLLTISADGAQYIALVTSEDPVKPMMFLSVGYDELMSSLDRLNDLDDEALEKIADSFRDEDVVEISYAYTAYGTKLMVVKEAREETDFVDFYTVYKGYEVEFVLTRGTDEESLPLTDAYVEMAIAFLSEMDFVPVAE
ncbi:MAG: hypothetical protein IKP40_06360 [Clostridia bacterium]|nr:hypothetical protein [Clostridia bacterium]